jgi:DNA repair exonuclease SbcCD ATPase subunit
MKRTRSTDKSILWDEAKNLFQEITRLRENIIITKKTFKTQLDELKTIDESLDDLYKKIQSERKILEEKKEMLKQKQQNLRNELRNMNDPVKKKDYFKKELDDFYLECQTLSNTCHENEILLFKTQKVWEVKLREVHEIHDRIVSLKNLMTQRQEEFHGMF